MTSRTLGLVQRHWANCNSVGARGSGLGTGDWGLGTGDWGLGTGDWGLGTGDWGLGTGDWGLGTRDSGFGTQDSGLRTRDPGFGIWDLGLGPLWEGGSLPAIVEADDDGLYVLKFRGGPARRPRHDSRRLHGRPGGRANRRAPAPGTLSLAGVAPQHDHPDVARPHGTDEGSGGTRATRRDHGPPARTALIEASHGADAGRFPSHAGGRS